MTSNVSRAAAEADRMIAELNQQRLVEAQAAQGESLVENQGEDTGASAVPQADEVVDQTDVGVQATSTPQVSDSELASLRKEVETANQRWKVLQGMIDKKDSEVDNMRALLAQLSQKAEAQKDEPKPSRVTNEDKETLESLDLLTPVTNIVNDVFETRIREVMTMIAKLEKSITGVGEMTANTSAELFDDALARQVPSWRQVNVDPAFIAWLQEEDGFTGKTKLALLTDAYSTGNLARTARFFKAFEEATGQVTAPETAQTKKDNVTKLVAPGKSRSSVTPQAKQDSAQIWTKGDISRLYDDKRNGRITQEEFDKYERDLFKAQGEGRIAA